MNRLSTASPQGTQQNPAREAYAAQSPALNVDSGFPAVQRLITTINSLPQRDASRDAEAAEYVMQSLAHENGFRGLWTPEERAVGAAFIKLRLGPRTAHYGWRLYKRYRATGGWDTEAFGY